MKYVIKKPTSGKRSALPIFLFLLIPFLFIPSCRKYYDYLGSGYNRPNGDCLVTYTEDDLVGYTDYFIYDKKGKLVSLDPDFAQTIDYDKKGRMIRFSYLSSGVHFDLSYNNNSFLPVAMKYYYPALGGLIGIDSFVYNKNGEIIENTFVNLWSPDYSSTWSFQYDAKHNVKKVTVKSSNGGTAYPADGYTFAEILKYDDKPNYLGGNQWLKYIMLRGGLDINSVILTSVNNAVDWIWYSYFEDGFPYHIKAQCQYNPMGFPNTITEEYFDLNSGESFGTITRKSTSTCDVKESSQNQASARKQNRKFLRSNEKLSIKGLPNPNERYPGK